MDNRECGITKNSSGLSHTQLCFCKFKVINVILFWFFFPQQYALKKPNAVLYKK